jgi:hypothetical protein
MKLSHCSDKTNVLVVPAEVYNLLDPIEQIILKRQQARGEVKILEPGMVAG